MNPLMIGVLLILLLLAAWQDCREYRISNRLVVSGALLGILINVLLPSGIGFLESFLGCVVGLLLLLPMYMLRTMGAGDVKLMAMVGAFVGLPEIIVVVLYTMLAGGVLSVCVAWHYGILRELMLNLRLTVYNFIVNLFQSKSKESPRETLSFVETMQKSSVKMPYGVAIAVGTAIFLILNEM